MHKKGNRKQPKKKKNIYIKNISIYIRYNTLSNQNTKKEKEELFT